MSGVVTLSMMYDHEPKHIVEKINLQFKRAKTYQSVQNWLMYLKVFDNLVGQQLDDCPVVKFTQFLLDKLIY